MFRYDNEEVGVHWATPGGGLDPGESPPQAAGRELREEAGWTGIKVPRTMTRLHPGRVPVRQHERIVLARNPRRDPVGDLVAVHAADGILRWRWRSPDELSATTEPLWPPQLPELLAAVREKGAPTTPVDLR